MEASRIISSDSHIVEPGDLWTGRIQRKFQERAPRMVREKQSDWWYVDGVRLTSTGAGINAGRRFEKSGTAVRESFAEEVRPGGYLPNEKIKDMDLDGVYGEVLYPSLALHFWRLKDSALLTEIFRTYNDWLAEFCSAAPNRIKGAACLNVDDVASAVAEMGRTAKLGLVSASITVYPPETRPYSDPMYDPLWAAAQDLNMSLSLHIGTNRELPSAVQAREPGAMPMKCLTTYSLRSTGSHWIAMTIADLTFAGVFERFPKLKVVSVEHEVLWAAHLLGTMDAIYKLGNWDGAIRFKDGKLPSDCFRNNVFLSFQEDKLGLLLRDFIGVDSLMWGSDYPHPESTFPKSKEILAGLTAEMSPDVKRKLVGGTAAKVFFFN